MKILHIQLDYAQGGIESFIYNVYSRINRKEFCFDFIEYGLNRRDYDKKYEELGGKIYNIPDRRNHPIKSKKELKKIIKKNNYDVIHIHKNSLCDMSSINACLSINVPIIIHSHNSSRDNKIVILMHFINKKLSRKKIKNIKRLACSGKAGKWMFNDDYLIINNGIELQKFTYNSLKRDEMRKKLNLSNEYVIGNIGRMSEQKNPFFLLNIFSKLKKINSNIKLLWVGDGELMDEAKKHVDKLGVSKDVIFTGRVSNPEDFYNVMDLFAMPSLYEGFPIAAIEAQTNDLICLLSDKITEESKITSKSKLLSIDNEEEWVLEIQKQMLSKDIRNDNFDIMKDKGYDINTTVILLSNIYKGIIDNNGK